MNINKFVYQITAEIIYKKYIKSVYRYRIIAFNKILKFM